MKFTIKKYTLDQELEERIKHDHSDYKNWPLVYLLKEDEKKKQANKIDIYIGETTNVIRRLKTHSKSENKQNLKSVYLILSDLLNKSAALDIESNLIRYLSADVNYSLQNGNLGISNHQYYQQKEIYQDLFKNIWTKLIEEKIAQQALDKIDNSDLFKYSPYKSLSEEQIEGIKNILKCLLDENAKVSLFEGGAGTGKSILAIFLFKLLKTDLRDFNYIDFDEDDKELFDSLKKVKEKYDDLNMALVIPMGSFRQTIKKVFRNINGLNSKMVIGPSEIVEQKYDLLIVDEAHRLRRRKNLGNYFATFDKNCRTLGLDEFTASELDWIQLQSTKSIIFYDQLQSIKPSDVAPESFHKLKQLPTTRKEKLSTQLRIKGGNRYVKFVDQLFENTPQLKKNTFKGIDYDLRMFENLDQMVYEIQKKDKKKELCRMIAGFSWKWISKKNRSLFDIQIGTTKLQWNSTKKDWVNSPNAINEVGCIHTTQGYDLNYAGVIIGWELDYDFDTNQFIVYKEKYKDRNGKNSITDDQVLLSYILNIYRSHMLRGIEGTYIYICNPNLRKYFAQFFPIIIKDKNNN